MPSQILRDSSAPSYFGEVKALEAENAKLKKMLAEQMLDVATLKEMLGENF